MHVVQAFCNLIRCFLHTVMYGDTDGGFSCLPLVPAYRLDQRIYYIEIKRLATACRDSRIQKIPDVLIPKYESLV